jgi:hypothetical protein
MRRFLRQLLCRHTLVFARNLYGDQINAHGGQRSQWYCARCGVTKYQPTLHTSKP